MEPPSSSSEDFNARNMLKIIKNEKIGMQYKDINLKGSTIHYHRLEIVKWK